MRVYVTRHDFKSHSLGGDAVVIAPDEPTAHRLMAEACSKGGLTWDGTLTEVSLG
ncbi:hypothetical protein ACFFLM_00405 [Deinococcus oregonensis]|uniref:Uncharacterized protein n=1 Tax=Deinococcus oregonensis TaxID=1805970 RepID=A0ABV6ASI2_9DEIO